jgi:hypothetical protein
MFWLLAKSVKETFSEGPGELSYHSATVIGDQFFIFGGLSKQKCSSQLWSYNMGMCFFFTHKLHYIDLLIFFCVLKSH